MVGRQKPGPDGLYRAHLIFRSHQWRCESQAWTLSSGFRLGERLESAPPKQEMDVTDKPAQPVQYTSRQAQGIVRNPKDLFSRFTAKHV